VGTTISSNDICLNWNCALTDLNETNAALSKSIL
jgi:hypothetical protein